MASEAAAFAPKSDYEDPDSFGAVFVNDETEVNLREEFRTGLGYFVTEDPDTIRVLDNYPAVKRATVAEVERARSSAEGASGASGRKSPSGGGGKSGSGDSDGNKE